MTDKPRSPWFQLHLSTATVLMFVAGGLLWANVRVTKASQLVHFRSVNGPGEETIIWFSKGFPVSFDRWSPTVSRDVLVLRGAPAPTFTDELYENPYTWIAFDIVVSILILASVLAICEWLIRRREARKP